MIALSNTLQSPLFSSVSAPGKLEFTCGEVQESSGDRRGVLTVRKTKSWAVSGFVSSAAPARQTHYIPMNATVTCSLPSINCIRAAGIR